MFFDKLKATYFFAKRFIATLEVDMKRLLAFAAILILSGCGTKDPLANLGEVEKAFLFGDDESRIAFLGKPNGGAEISCDPRNMGQGIIFMSDDKGVWIESIRPSGTIKHKVKAVQMDNQDIKVEALNGAGVPFTLKFSQIEDDKANISFDGDKASEFLRCIK